MFEMFNFPIHINYDGVWSRMSLRVKPQFYAGPTSTLQRLLRKYAKNTVNMEYVKFDYLLYIFVA